MANFLYDKMSRNVRAAILFLMAFLYFSVIGTIIYIIAHFVAKYW